MEGPMQIVSLADLADEEQFGYASFSWAVTVSIYPPAFGIRQELALCIGQA